MRVHPFTTALLAAGLLGLALLGSGPTAQACSIVREPTGCVSDIYKDQRDKALARAAALQAWASAFGQAAPACAPSPQGGGPADAAPALAFAEAARQGATEFLGRLPGDLFPASAAFVAGAWGSFVNTAITYDDRVEAMLLGLAPDPAGLWPPPDPSGVAEGLAASAGLAQQAAEGSAACVTSLPRPA